MRIFTGCIFFLLCVSNSFADATYDSENKLVKLGTELLSADTGWIKIYNEKHIEIGGIALNKTNKKMIGMCGNKPSLGLLFLNGKLKLDGKVPKVTSVLRSTDKSESGKETIAAGWVHSFVLKGEDAQDLMDLLYENRSVGFAVLSGEGCKETEYYTQGKLVMDFSTQGLDRAMKRLK